MESTQIELIGLVLAALPILGTIWVWMKGRKQRSRKNEVPYLFEDAEGQPQVDIVIVGPGGHCLSTDERGMALVPHSWLGKTLYLRHAKTGCRITSFQPNGQSDEPRTFTVPKS